MQRVNGLLLALTLTSGISFGEVAWAGEETSPSQAALEQLSAQELFEQGRQAMEAGDHETACARFEQSAAIKKGIGTTFNLADCLEQLGRTASAYALFLDVANETAALGQAERSEVARARAEALKPRLPRLMIELTEPPPDVEVHQDGVLVAAALVGSARPLDAGKHEIEVTAPGKRRWSMKIDVPASGSVTVLTVPELTDAEPSPPVVTDEPKPEPEPAAEPAAEPVAASPVQQSDSVGAEPARSGSGRAVLTYSLAGLGVIGVAGGVVMGLDFNTNNERAKDICPSSRDCSLAEIERHGELVDAARRSRNWAYVSGGAGVALLLGAGILWLTAPDDEQTASSSRGWAAVPVLSTDGWGASVAGRF